VNKVTKLKLQKIKPIVEQIVESKLIKLLGALDSGLELKDNVRQRLQKSLHSKTHGVSESKVAKRLGLHW